MVALHKTAVSRRLVGNDHTMKVLHSHFEHLEAVDCRGPQELAVEKALDGPQGDEGCGYRTFLI